MAVDPTLTPKQQLAAARDAAKLEIAHKKVEEVQARGKARQGIQKRAANDSGYTPSGIEKKYTLLD
jgi:hypothetical protein